MEYISGLVTALMMMTNEEIHPVLEEIIRRVREMNQELNQEVEGLKNNPPLKHKVEIDFGYEDSRKIAAIKAVRQITPIGLKETLEACQGTPALAYITTGQILELTGLPQNGDISYIRIRYKKNQVPLEAVA